MRSNTKISKKNESTENRILDAARSEFVDKGLSGARMQIIADTAGVNKALLHYYFKSKQSLYEAVLHNIISTFWEGLLHRMPQRSETYNIEQFIDSIVRTYIDTMQRHSDFPRMFMRELVDGNAVLPQVFGNVVNKLGHVPYQIFSVLQQMRSKGMIKNIDPFHIVINIMGMCAASFFMYPLIATVIGESSEMKLSIDENDFFQQRITVITETICRGIVVPQKDRV